MRISKYLKTLAIAIPIGWFATAANVHAFTHGMVNVGVATERVSASSGFIDERSAAERVAVTCTGAIALNDRVSFALNNGATFNNPTALKLFRAPAGVFGNLAANPSVGALTVSNNGATIEFDITTAGTVATDVLYVAVTAGGTNYVGPQVTIPPSLPVATQISVSVATTAVGELGLSAPLYSVYQQFTTNYAGNARLISINKGLLKFADIVGSTDVQSRAMVSRIVTNNAVGGDISAINFGPANIVYTLSGNMVGVANVQLVNTATTVAVAGQAIVVSIANNTATVTVSLNTVIGVLTDILVTVNGTTALEERSFNLSVDVTAGGDIARGVNMVSATTASGTVISTNPVGWAGSIFGGKANLVWTADGLQFIVAYVRNDPTAGITTAIRMENVTGVNRNYWVLVNNQPSAGGKWKMILTTQPILAGTVVTLLGSDIVTAAAAAGVTIPTTGTAVRILVDEAANPQNIALYATQFVGGAYRSLQVLKNNPTGTNYFE